MSAGFLFGLTGAIIGVVSAVVAVTTKINHTDHNKAMIVENRKLFDDYVKKTDKNFGKLFDEVKDLSEDVSYIKGKMNNN